MQAGEYCKGKMRSFLFYDIETSGLHPAFDQVLTFACIRTDLKLNEMERESITIRLRDDIVPSPRAFLTHRLTAQQLEKGVKEYEAALQIHKILNTPGTISIGYNSLGFDDEFLRFMFYRNLLDPYSHQFSKGCSRADILPVAVVFRLFCPEIVNWPEKEGKTSLKLEMISEKNRFSVQGRAHEAMSDVEALVSFAEKMAAKKEIWQYSLDFFNKNKDEIRISNIQPDCRAGNEIFRTAVMLSASFGPDLEYMAPVLHLGRSDAYKNQDLWLRLDQESIPGLSGDDEVDKGFVIRKRPGDAFIVLPPLDRFRARLVPDSRIRAGENINRIKENCDNFLNLVSYHKNYQYPFIPDIDSDAGLYQEGFFSHGEKIEIARVHQLIAKTGTDSLHDQIMNRVQSPRIKELAFRIAARNFKTKGSMVLQREKACLRSASDTCSIKGYKNDVKRNCTEAMQELLEAEQEIKEVNDETREILAWLKGCIKGF